MTWNITAIDEERADITATVEWPARWQWVLHLWVWRSRNPGMSN